jgi:hypothetical protein
MAGYIDRSDVFNPQTPLALKDNVWSVLTLDSQNRLKVVPTRFTDLFSNFTARHLGASVYYTNHDWTTRITETVPQGHVYVIQGIRFSTSIPSSNTMLGIRLDINQTEAVTFIAGSGTNDANRVLNLPMHYILAAGETYAIKTYSTDTASRNFTYYIHIIDFTII